MEKSGLSRKPQIHSTVLWVESTDSCSLRKLFRSSPNLRIAKPKMKQSNCTESSESSSSLPASSSNQQSVPLTWEDWDKMLLMTETLMKVKRQLKSLWVF